MRGKYRISADSGKYRVSPDRRHRKVFASLRLVSATAIAAAVVAGILTADSPTAAARARPPIMVSVKADRSAAQDLANSTQSGVVYIFVTASAQADAVNFVLDQGTNNERTLTDQSAPYDLAGTAPDGTARPLDLSTLAVGLAQGRGQGAGRVRPPGGP